ncbi:TMEM165/GDT1 family protein [Natranaerofaba carboxydovora]|uniref:TMEM165/GDT1 family protein n=1 Tax=Natranaerofaba carboxydovora TaxID=2742683 RepID=UPI001F135E40|nr:TMEM165/GDT1 family protein [Natranaerofaba carboxydovora]UMZ75259.1 hypothetical protein ACONDI_02878 [Natranaerofaba carboxydovora]
MFWESLLVTFGMVFLAELGDKTQLATMLLATQKKSLLGVFIGASTALILASFLGVMLGNILTKYLPPNILKNGAGVAFIILGVVLLISQK